MIDAFRQCMAEASEIRRAIRHLKMYGPRVDAYTLDVLRDALAERRECARRAAARLRTA